MNTSQYLTFEILTNGVVDWCSNNNSSIHNTIEYRKNGGNWTSITSTQAGVNISVVAGDILEFRGDNATYSDGSYRYGMFGDGKTTAQFKAYGNIMSLINSTDFANLKTLSTAYTFRAMFNNCSGLTDASELLLPVTGLTTGSYRFMFQGCSGMTTAPVLPAETLTSECYYGMFNNCSRLNNITCLATNTSASNCLNQWVNGVQTTSGTFFKNPSMTSWTRGINGVPNNWTIEDYVSFGPDVEELTFDSSGGTQSIELLSDNPWTATTNDWITLSQSTGETGGVITVTVADNIFSQKIGSITFTDGENTATVSVEQKGDSMIILKNLYRNGNKVKQIFKNGEKLYQIFERFIFEVDADSLTFDYEGNTLTLTITASDPWTMTKPEWITASSVSGIGNTTVTLTVPQNPTEDSRDGNIVLTCEGRTITIPVEQKGDIGLDTPLTFEIISDGYITLAKKSSGPTVTVQYRINEGSWVTITSSSSNRINVVNGDKVEFKGTNASFGITDNRYNTFSGSTANYNLTGNIMSLLYGDDFATATTLSAEYTFSGLFRNNSGVVDASGLILPATSLRNYCYNRMFGDCNTITKAPELPATSLTYYCYHYMFVNCPNLVQAPSVLPATVLATGCYQEMFQYCKITTAPEILATTIGTSSLTYMFSGCTNLNYVKCLATSGISTSNSNNWLAGVSASGTFVKKTGVSWSSGNSGIPSGWTVQEADE